jgi:hypothetical protein
METDKEEILILLPLMEVLLIFIIVKLLFHLPDTIFLNLILQLIDKLQDHQEKNLLLIIIKVMEVEGIRMFYKIMEATDLNIAIKCLLKGYLMIVLENNKLVL